MASVKITITLESEQLKEIRALVSANVKPSVSAFVQHAVRVALSDAAGWRELLEEELEKTGGPLTENEINWAESILGSGSSQDALNTQRVA